jgi:predicted transcriptional regulator
MESLGELERTALEQLWSAEGALTPGELRERLATGDDRGLALTTVMTVLSRLEKKGFVARDRTVRPATYAPLHAREDYVAELMHDALGAAGDRTAALARFVGRASEDETAALKRLLGLV